MKSFIKKLIICVSIIAYSISYEVNASDIPDVVMNDIKEKKKVCLDAGGVPKQDQNFIRVLDITGDGGIGYVVDYGMLGCEGAESVYGRASEISLFVPNEDSQLEKSNALREIATYGLEFDDKSSPPVIMVEVRGQDCGQHITDSTPISEYQYCKRPFLWDKQLKKLRLSSGEQPAKALSQIEQDGFRWYVADYPYLRSQKNCPQKVSAIEHFESPDDPPKKTHIIGYEFSCDGTVRRGYIGFTVESYNDASGSYVVTCMHVGESKDKVIADMLDESNWNPSCHIVPSEMGVFPQSEKMAVQRGAESSLTTSNDNKVTMKKIAISCGARNGSGSLVEFPDENLPDGFSSDDVCVASRSLINNHYKFYKNFISHFCSDLPDIIKDYGSGKDINVYMKELIASGDPASMTVGKMIDNCYNDAMYKTTGFDVSVYSLGRFIVNGRQCKGVLRVWGGAYQLFGIGDCENVSVDPHSIKTLYSSILRGKYKYDGKIPEKFTAEGVTRPF